MPKVSVIMPVYNTKEAYLRQAIESVLAQTFTDFEFIIVNDDSNDDTVKIIDEYANSDERIKVISQKVNSGTSSARNAGLSVALGDFVMFVDSDDVYSTELLACLHKEINEYRADIAACLVKNMQSINDVLSDNKNKYTVSIYDNPLKIFMKKRFVRTEVYARLYKKELLNGLRFLEGIRYEDVHFTSIVMSKAQSLIMINKELYGYRKHADSFMMTDFTTEKASYYLRVIKEIYDYFQKENPSVIKDVRRYILNKRIKMIFNQSIKRQRNAEERNSIFSYLQQNLKQFYAQGVINYQGLKLKHKVSLWLLLHQTNPQYCQTWINLAKEF